VRLAVVVTAVMRGVVVTALMIAVPVAAVSFFSPEVAETAPGRYRSVPPVGGFRLNGRGSPVRDVGRDLGISVVPSLAHTRGP